jgi:hypothetical protein
MPACWSVVGEREGGGRGTRIIGASAQHTRGQESGGEERYRRAHICIHRRL